jgi:hypothetical protein
MRRALVLIGVSRTGGKLDELKSIESSFRQMRAWAEEQGFDREIYEISDLKGGVVRLSDIAELIQRLDDSSTPPDQLVVYFNGHGVRNGSGDLWLLSKAPNQAKEAVNLFSCLAGAYYRYFKHVVLIGDACRVHPDDKQFNSVEGASIFQNGTEDGNANSVDIFFASTVGTAALEVDINKEPTSIYTLQLSEFLRGSEPSILETLHPPDVLPKVVRSGPLKKALPTAVRARLRKYGITQNVRPDAILTSDPVLWLSTFDHDPLPIGSSIDSLGKSMTIPPTEGPKSDIPPQPGAPKIHDAPVAPSDKFQQQLEAALSASQSDAISVGEEPQSWIPEGFHFETSCGFHLSGAQAIDAKVSGEGKISVNGELVRIRASDPQLCLITLQDQSGLLLPVIPDHIGFVRFREGSVEDMAYEPSANFGANYERQETRYKRFSPNATVIRGVRETLASAAWTGNLLLAVLSHNQIREAIDIAKYSDNDVDAMLLVLLGYGCVASGKQEWLPELCELCLDRLKFLPFDLKLLTEVGPFRRRVASQETLPPFPLLRQGWSLLSSTGALFREQTTELRDQILPSPWTVLSPTGIVICKRYIQEEEKGEKSPAVAIH